ncbi:hypothetical protein ABB37_06614 [Leptomonas pyrrhocoris]|uniref:SMP-30/Gluconolactonase/LRE-like region domain-containing protein n=1 Tax=Leptomonas pyrrhocoris TaxID=157538 RepID=A0A0M9FWZ6_LEPPY|nr:hypothetical protein ABB37_06614 [Leptomonas pyrrhocoris]XP_015656224.1 hypothetical protein ABB37_06614 [Leptomonas pyrrhocoris]XP_015656225.1 hypothetical protein ABB37_06614 [Leptomonas pyrrhocoris]KPA77784.1 hypothetical protein ABB37_06614 [Leptomonas pyrrhocoris]KPA77785.1 hypothetical protein ABB37_06614 [Leptomonas pyrrhocoris]KPA77786.1 hypothetical protein ABB37_06614 [Leptomonas pyrrhocoris]|eukprot:XP_015656223.1 hypothetical protein ABB37_06614 [Leptomonas pyrrhocoris]
MNVAAESHQHFLTSLAIDPSTDELYALCAASGEVLRYNAERQTFTEVAKTDVPPASFAFLTDGEEMRWVMACPMQRTLLTTSATVRQRVVEEGTEELPVVTLAPYAACSHAPPLNAPTAVTVSPCDGEVFFTDAGWEGDSSLLNRTGAVYRTVQRHSAVVALQPTGLAQPSSVVVGRDGCVYVAEMVENRLLRYVPRGGGVRYIGAVFARFEGSMGPSAVVVHPRTGHLFVALYEAAEVGRPYEAVDDETSSTAPPLQGRVVELDLSGAEVCTYHVPDTQLRALAFDVQGTCLYAVSSDSNTYWSTLYQAALNEN